MSVFVSPFSTTSPARRCTSTTTSTLASLPTPQTEFCHCRLLSLFTLAPTDIAHVHLRHLPCPFQHNITSSAVHQRNDIHPCVASYAARLPQLNTLADEILCLPVGWWVGPQEVILLIIAYVVIFFCDCEFFIAYNSHHTS